MLKTGSNWGGARQTSLLHERLGKECVTSPDNFCTEGYLMVAFSSKTLELSGLFLLVFSEGTNFVSLKTNVVENLRYAIEVWR